MSGLKTCQRKSVSVSLIAAITIDNRIHALIAPTPILARGNQVASNQPARVQLVADIPSYTTIDDLWSLWNNGNGVVKALKDWTAQDISLPNTASLSSKQRNSRKSKYCKRKRVCLFIESFPGTNAQQLDSFKNHHDIALLKKPIGFNAIIQVLNHIN
jgi:hypothetical protein